MQLSVLKTAVSWVYTMSQSYSYMLISKVSKSFEITLQKTFSINTLYLKCIINALHLYMNITEVPGVDPNVKM